MVMVAITFSEGCAFIQGSWRSSRIESKGCELVYLPPYSPDFNPIEQAFSKLKSYLGDARARSQQALMEVIGEALSTISRSDALGFFEHCGYRAVVQSL
jgi:DDE superfamily endonuclease